MTTFTKAYFFEQVNEFRKMMGDITYWVFEDKDGSKELKIGRYWYALLYVYSNIEDFDESCENIMVATQEEYTLRTSHMMLRIPQTEWEV